METRLYFLHLGEVCFPSLFSPAGGFGWSLVDGDTLVMRPIAGHMLRTRQKWFLHNLGRWRQSPEKQGVVCGVPMDVWGMARVGKCTGRPTFQSFFS